MRARAILRQLMVMLRVLCQQERGADFLVAVFIGEDGEQDALDEGAVGATRQRGDRAPPVVLKGGTITGGTIARNHRRDGQVDISGGSSG